MEGGGKDCQCKSVNKDCSVSYCVQVKVCKILLYNFLPPNLVTPHGSIDAVGGHTNSAEQHVNEGSGKNSSAMNE